MSNKGGVAKKNPPSFARALRASYPQKVNEKHDRQREPPLDRLWGALVQQDLQALGHLGGKDSRLLRPNGPPAFLATQTFVELLHLCACFPFATVSARKPKRVRPRNERPNPETERKLPFVARREQRPAPTRNERRATHTPLKLFFDSIRSLQNKRDFWRIFHPWPGVPLI